MAFQLPEKDSLWAGGNLIFVFFFVGLFVLALGVGLFLFKGGGRSDEIQIIPQTSQPAQAEIVVDIAGAVVSGGVYKLPTGARVDDAVKAAGGLTDDADRQKINLAAKIVDGQKVYILAEGESTSTTSLKGATSTTGLISINLGSKADLESLPQVGPVTAQKIIDLRPYSTVEELKSKKAVGASTFEKIKDLVTL